tara:strand:- start:12655 stop:13422 length:768 start_codon:yes stop_codon:yes gene_type:complete
MAWFTPSGQPTLNDGSTASNPPTVDIQTEVGGTPMFKEDYAPQSASVVTESERVQGREAYELFDGLRILGKDINSAGLANNKFLKYDSTNEQWVVSDATGTSNLSDLADVADGTPTTFDTLKWGGSSWDFLSGISSSYLASPVGNNVTFGITDGSAEVRIQGGSTSNDKKISFGYTNGSTYTEQWTLGNEDTQHFTIKDKDGHTGLKIAEDTNLVTMERMRLNDQGTQTANSGSMYYNSTSNEWFMSIDDGIVGG